MTTTQIGSSLNSPNSDKQRNLSYYNGYLWAFNYNGDNNRFEFWYSSNDGASWTENTSARITPVSSASLTNARLVINQTNGIAAFVYHRVSSSVGIAYLHHQSGWGTSSSWVATTQTINGATVTNGVMAVDVAVIDRTSGSGDYFINVHTVEKHTASGYGCFRLRWHRYTSSTDAYDSSGYVTSVYNTGSSYYPTYSSVTTCDWAHTGDGSTLDGDPDVFAAGYLQNTDTTNTRTVVYRWNGTSGTWWQYDSEYNSPSSICRSLDSVFDGTNFITVGLREDGYSTMIVLSVDPATWTYDSTFPTAPQACQNATVMVIGDGGKIALHIIGSTADDVFRNEYDGTAWNGWTQITTTFVWAWTLTVLHYPLAAEGYGGFVYATNSSGPYDLYFTDYTLPMWVSASGATTTAGSAALNVTHSLAASGATTTKEPIEGPIPFYEDNFDSFNTSYWYLYSGSTTPTCTDGLLTLTNTGGTWDRFDANNPTTLYNEYEHIFIVDSWDKGSGSTTSPWIPTIDFEVADLGSQVSIQFDHDTTPRIYMYDGVTEDEVAQTFTPAGDYYRVRESGGTISFATSADGATWTTHGSLDSTNFVGGGTLDWQPLVSSGYLGTIVLDFYGLYSLADRALPRETTNWYEDNFNTFNTAFWSPYSGDAGPTVNAGLLTLANTAGEDNSFDSLVRNPNDKSTDFIFKIDSWTVGGTTVGEFPRIIVEYDSNPYTSIVLEFDDATTPRAYMIGPSTTHRARFTPEGDWWRIREWLGVLSVSTSADGSTWTVHASLDSSLAGGVYYGQLQPIFRSGTLGTLVLDYYRHDLLESTPIGQVISDLAASGATATSGSADIKKPLSFSATGSTSSSGTADIIASRPLTASGATTTSGTADLTQTHVVSASGATSTAGSAAIGATHALSFAGQGLSHSDDFNDLADDSYLYQRSTWTTNKSSPPAMRSDRHADTDDGTQVLDGSADFGTTTNAEYALYDTVLGSDDHVVSADVFPDSDGTDADPNWIGVIARSDDTAGTNCYWAAADVSSAREGFTLWRRVSGVNTEIGHWASTHNTTSVYELELKVDGSTISVTVDGVERISETDTTITSGRYAGIVFLRATSAVDAQPWIDNWAAADLAGSGGGATVTSGSADIQIPLPLSASGATTSSGSADIIAARPLAASGATTTTGTSPALTRVTEWSNYSSSTTDPTAVAHPLTASGATTTGGTANINTARPVSATGATTTAGSADILTSRTLAATGATATAGSAAFLQTHAVSASGATTTSGTATLGSLSRPISATGSTTTSGSADILASRNLSASGTTTTSGSAALESLSRPLSATGAVTTLGSAALTQTHAASASGTTPTTGTADIIATRPLSATGATTTVGSVAISTARPVSADGATTTSGTADILTTRNLEASGATSTSGTVSFLVVWALAASGTTSSTGSADLIATRPISASGATTTTGTADISTARPLVSSGVTTTAGTADIALSHSITSDGATATTGSADILTARTLQASGATATIGTADIISTRPLSATGATVTSGTSSLTVTHSLVADGATSTAGSADTQALFALASTGTTPTDGSADPNAIWALAATGATTTLGFAELEGAGPRALSASGHTQTSGSVDITGHFTFDVTGATATSGSADIRTFRPLSASGATSTAGTSDVNLVASYSASGATSTTGSSDLQVTHSLTASGSTSTGGSASIIRIQVLGISAAGATSTSGTAALGTGHPVSAAGASATSGTADINTAWVVTASGATTTDAPSPPIVITRSMFATGAVNTVGTGSLGLSLPLLAAGLTTTAGTGYLQTTHGLFATGLTQTDGSVNIIVPLRSPLWLGDQPATAYLGETPVQLAVGLVE